MAERWLVTGASGQLGGHVLRQLRAAHPDDGVLALAGSGAVREPDVSVERPDLADEEAVQAVIAWFQPTTILHLGGITGVGEARADPARADRVNVRGTRAIADAAAGCDARLVYASTDMVFDGTAAPYDESAPPRPLSVYGKTKAAAEPSVTGFRRGLVIRLPLMAGKPCTQRETTFAKQVQALESGAPLKLFTDEYRTPLSLHDAGRALVGVATSDRVGILHVAGPERLTRYEMVLRIARRLGVDEPRLKPISRTEIESPEPRPEDLSLCCDKFLDAFADLRPGPFDATAFA